MLTAYKLTSCAYLSVYTALRIRICIYRILYIGNIVVCIVCVNIFLKGKNIEKYFSLSYARGKNSNTWNWTTRTSKCVFIEFRKHVRFVSKRSSLFLFSNIFPNKSASFIITLTFFHQLSRVNHVDWLILGGIRKGLGQHTR